MSQHKIDRKIRNPDLQDVDIPDSSEYDPMETYDPDNVNELKSDEVHTPLEKELDALLKEKGLKYPNKNIVRNLPQYSKLSEEEFEEKYAKMVMGVRYDREWEKRILLRMKQFERDYDLSDLKINDLNNLRLLAAAQMRLEDYDSVISQTNSKGITQSNINLIKELGGLQKDLRDGIAKLEDTLKISRKIRKSEEENSVPSFLDDLKKKAKQFYEQKMMYIICPKCNTLLATTWFLYPNHSNRIQLTCHHILDSGEVCNTIINFNSKELVKTKMTNRPDTLPESML
jgi:hypothetical protein